MAEINKIKVGETTYDVNPSWAIKNGDALDIVNMGQATSVGIGASSASPVDVTIGEAGTTVVLGERTSVFGQSALSIGTTDYPNASVHIIGNVDVNGEELALGTLNNLVNFKDGMNLYIGTQAPQIQIGTGSASIRLGSDQSIQIGLVGKGITLGSAGDVQIGDGSTQVSFYNTKATYIDAINGDIYIGANAGTDKVTIGDNAFVWNDTDDSVSIDGCKFRYNSATSIFTISYNGKKAEIQLT